MNLKTIIFGLALALAAQSDLIASNESGASNLRRNQQNTNYETSPKVSQTTISKEQEKAPLLATSTNQNEFLGYKYGGPPLLATSTNQNEFLGYKYGGPPLLATSTNQNEFLGYKYGGPPLLATSTNQNEFLGYKYSGGPLLATSTKQNQSPTSNLPK